MGCGQTYGAPGFDDRDDMVNVISKPRLSRRQELSGRQGFSENGVTA
jgi:hypothetical protein